MKQVDASLGKISTSPEGRIENRFEEFRKRIDQLRSEHGGY